MLLLLLKKLNSSAEIQTDTCVERSLIGYNSVKKFGPESLRNRNKGSDIAKY